MSTGIDWDGKRPAETPKSEQIQAEFDKLVKLSEKTIGESPEALDAAETLESRLFRIKKLADGEGHHNDRLAPQMLVSDVQKHEYKDWTREDFQKLVELIEANHGLNIELDALEPDLRASITSSVRSKVRRLLHVNASPEAEEGITENVLTQYLQIAQGEDVEFKGPRRLKRVGNHPTEAAIVLSELINREPEIKQKFEAMKAKVGQLDPKIQGLAKHFIDTVESKRILHGTGREMNQLQNAMRDFILMAEEEFDYPIEGNMTIGDLKETRYPDWTPKEFHKLIAEMATSNPRLARLIEKANRRLS